MVLTNNKKLSKVIRHLSTTAKKDPIVLSHDKVGYNYRMPNLNASLGLAQLSNLNQILKAKKETSNIWNYI